MEVYFATTNEGKFYSISKELGNYGIKVIQVPLKLPEPRSDDPSEIVKEKVIYAYEHLKKPCIANDGGFFIDALNGFPKAYVNFALETIGIEGILKLMEDKEDRRCEFRDALAFYDSTLGNPKVFTSITRGNLTYVPRGKLKVFNRSTLHLIFIPGGSKKTLAEMNEKEYWEWKKNRYEESCTTKFAKWFISRYSK